MATNFSGAQGFLQNPLIATLSPDQQQNLLQLQQRQAVGQALLAQGLQPADYGGTNIGGLAYHVSPLNGISKLVNAYVGNKLSMDAMGQQAQLMGQMYGNAFGTTPGGSPAAPADGIGQTVDVPPPAAADTGALQGPSAGLGLTQPTPVQLGQAMGAQAPRAASPMAGPMTLPGKTPQESMLLYSMLGPEGYARVAAAWGAPTDATRMALAGGVDPASANRDALFKANYVAPNQGTPGTIARDPRTNQPIYYSPSVPDGAQPVFDASGNLAGVAPLAGAREAIAGAAQARTAGEGAALPYAGFDAAGNPMPVTNRTAAAMGGGAPGAPRRTSRRSSCSRSRAEVRPLRTIRSRSRSRPSIALLNPANRGTTWPTATQSRSACSRSSTRTTVATSAASQLLTSRARAMSLRPAARLHT
ncbi:hypothetical protein [Burkholderia cepacia]|uniref:hypothetical protein n=1 Tax=Burkholderia cepacia TaxID=292 RepID=UPI001F230D52|nr:hypothetical protein [Burkholderia cepacia]UIY60081.1 hypothetical protein LZ568_18770 [Burkholderia cepacia]